MRIVPEPSAGGGVSLVPPVCARAGSARSVTSRTEYKPNRWDFTRVEPSTQLRDWQAHRPRSAPSVTVYDDGHTGHDVLRCRVACSHAPRAWLQRLSDGCAESPSPVSVQISCAATQ